MTIHEDIITALSGVVGNRVFPQMAPAETALPFVVYRVLNKDAVATINGVVQTTNYSIEFACFGANMSGAVSTAEAVATAIDASSLVSYREAAPGEDYHPEVDVFMEPIYYGFWY